MNILIYLMIIVSMIHYLNAEWLLVILAGLPSYVYYTLFAILIAIKSIMALSKLTRSLRDLYNRVLRLTSGIPRSQGPVIMPAPKQIGKPRRFSMSSLVRSAKKNPSSFDSNIKMKGSKIYERILDTIEPVDAMLKVKLGRPLVNHLLRCVRLAGMEVNFGLVKVIITFCAFCYRKVQSNGLKGLVIYLKACTVILQQATGRHKLHNMTPLGVRFARSKSGFPTCIPVLHRLRILKGDHLIIKVWMTLFSIYRVIEIPYKFSLKTITTPPSMVSDFPGRFSTMLELHFWPALINFPRFDDTRIGLNWDEPEGFLRGLRAVPYIISKASPAAGLIRLDEADRSPLSTSPAGILAAVAAWFDNPEYFEILRVWCQFTGNQWLINRMESWNRILLPMSDPAEASERKEVYKGMRTVLGQVYARSLGKLGFKEEAAGKLRVFAYVDPFTQWLMKPLHDAIFELLDLIPQDGTTDQLAPIKELIITQPHGPYYSFDLSAATDRLPIHIQKIILSKIMTIEGADLWALLLIGRSYEYHYKLKKRNYSGSVKYATGQPMGALSSWAMLALTHHAIVQQAALNAQVIRPGEWFTLYAVLGDDIVIADAAVAREYRKLMAELGVEIGLAKSLISPDGLTLEFAKRTFHRGKDVSPVPFSEYWVGRQMLSASLELCKKYSLSLARYLDLFGFGYKAKGSASGSLMKLGQRLRHRILAFHSPFGPNPLSLGKFFSLKGLTKAYSWSERKISAFITAFVEKELIRIQDKLNSKDFLVLEQTIRDISYVNKDREYYGTLSRAAPGARKIDLKGLDPDRPTFAWNASDPAPRYIDKDLYYYVIDDLCHTVYREVFLDVLVELRELRYLIEDTIKAKSGPTLEQLELVVNNYYSLTDSLSKIPLPRELYERVEKDTPLHNLEIIKQWESYSRILRSTLSTNPRTVDVTTNVVLPQPH